MSSASVDKILQIKDDSKNNKTDKRISKVEKLLRVGKRSSSFDDEELPKNFLSVTDKKRSTKSVNSNSTIFGRVNLGKG